jgi:hypothetical protein
MAAAVLLEIKANLSVLEAGVVVVPEKALKARGEQLEDTAPAGTQVGTSR